MADRMKWILQVGALVLLGVVWAPGAATAETVTGDSVSVTWNCTGSPCPWGTTTANPAMVWPASVSPVSARLGYTATHAVYAPAAAVTGMTVTITSGSASIYAGAPDASTHRVVSNIATGQSFTITNVTAGEYVSVQSGNPFSFQLTDAPAPTTTTDHHHRTDDHHDRTDDQHDSSSDHHRSLRDDIANGHVELHREPVSVGNHHRQPGHGVARVRLTRVRTPRLHRNPRRVRPRCSRHRHDRHHHERLRLDLRRRPRRINTPRRLQHRNRTVLHHHQRHRRRIRQRAERQPVLLPTH